MAKSTKRKFLSFLNLLILFVLFFCLNGCGNKEDAITPTAGTGQQIAAFTGSPTSLSSGQTSILTVKVTNSAGAAVSGKAVTFTILSNNSGATITTLNGATTDAGGQALVLYTAGATNPTADVQDTIQASVTGATGVVIITRISTSTASTGHRMTLTSAATSLAAGQSSIITATVTNGSGNPASGQVVTFLLLSNNSGATITPLNGGTTDAGGQASATYTAGANSSTTNVQDMIQASVADATSAIIITRTAVSSTGLRLALIADVTSLAAGQTTIIRATVTDGSGNPASGQAVTFTMLSNNSGAPPLTILGLGVTDAGGQASATYTAGASNPTAGLQDTIQASVTDATSAIIITRTASSGATSTAASLDLLAQPTTVKSDDSTTSTITVRALNTLSAALSGVTITMGTDTGILSAPTAVTGSDGKATLTFSSGSNPFNRTATITATAGTATKQIPVQIVGSTVTLTSSATMLPDDGSSTITLTVTAKDAGGNTVSGTAVTLTPSGAGSVTITPATGTTNGSGAFTATVAGTAVGAVTITATALGATATKSLTVSASGAVFGIDKQWLNAVDIGNPKPTAMKIGDSLAIEVNAPAPTTNVTFATTTGKWNGLTKVETVAVVVGGKATATLTTTQAGIASVQVYDSVSPTTSDTLTVAMTSATAYKISLQATPTVVPKSVGTTTGFSTLIATVRDSSNYPVGGAPVSFDIINPTGGGETVSPVVVLTAATTTGGLNLGEARTTFSSGSLSSSTSGVQIRASVVGTTVATGTSPSGSDATVVIGGSAGSVAIGRATKVATSVNNASYILPMSVLVADSNGNPAPAGTQISLSAWPIAWTTGTNCTPDPDYYSVWNTVTLTYDFFRYTNRGTFRGEDANENLVVDAGEDGTRIFYADGVTAVGTGKVDGYLTPTNSAGGTVPATVTTDANGVANFNLTYLKANALWTLTRIRASAIVQGSETVGQVIFRLPVLVPDDVEYNGDGSVKTCYLPNSPYIF